jgi:hypothetical protein
VISFTLKDFEPCEETVPVDASSSFPRIIQSQMICVTVEPFEFPDNCTDQDLSTRPFAR